MLRNVSVTFLKGFHIASTLIQCNKAKWKLASTISNQFYVGSWILIDNTQFYNNPSIISIQGGEEYLYHKDII